MAQYIDKSAVVEEIKERIDRDNEMAASYPSNSEHDYFYRVKEKVYKSLLSFIDTLEVKEVDLEKEIQQHINDCLDIKFPTTDIKTIAKDVEYTAHKFFELGLKVKGE